MVGVSVQLIVEHKGPKIVIYKRETQNKWGDNIYPVDDLALDYVLQTTLDNEVFLQLYEREDKIYFNFDQSGSLIFLEKLIDDERYITYGGDLWSNEEVSESCDPIDIDIKSNIQRVWDIREQILCWLSSGG